jgi:hypothetical protein
VGKWNLDLYISSSAEVDLRSIKNQNFKTSEKNKKRKNFFVLV